MPPQPRTIIATNSLRIVCKDVFRATMNAELAKVDSSGEPDVLSTPLYPADQSPQIAPVAWFTVWAMDDTQRSGINQALSGWRPLSGSEDTILGPADPVPAFSTKQRYWVWDSYTSTTEHALNSLGLRLPQGE